MDYSFVISFYIEDYQHVNEIKTQKSLYYIVGLLIYVEIQYETSSVHEIELLYFFLNVAMPRYYLLEMGPPPLQYLKQMYIGTTRLSFKPLDPSIAHSLVVDKENRIC